MYFYNVDDRSMDDEMSRTVDFSLPLALKSVTSDMINPENEVNAKVSITFLGRNITSTFGIHLFKILSIVIPLIPTFVLVMYNGIQLEVNFLYYCLTFEGFGLAWQKVKKYSQNFCFSNICQLETDSKKSRQDEKLTTNKKSIFELSS